MKRILIFNVNWLGDTLFSTPFIKAVRKRFPESYIVCLAPPRCKEILDDNPYLDGLIIYDEKGYHRSIFGKLRLIRELRREHFDGTFILHRSFTRALIAYLSGIRERIGYKTKRRSILLTRAIEEPSSPLHKVDYFLNIAALCGMETGGKGYDFFVRGAERKRVEDFLEKMGVHEDDLLVVLNPGGNWLPKRWPAERFSEIADRLADELGFGAHASCGRGEVKGDSALWPDIRIVDRAVRARRIHGHQKGCRLQYPLLQPCLH